MRSGDPRFCEDLRILDCHLVNKVVERWPTVAFDHMLLVAMKPPDGTIPYSLINRDGVDDQRISFPMAPLLSVERGLRICGMRTPIGGEYAKVMICVDEFHQLAGRLHQLHTMRARTDGWNTIRHT